MIRVLPGAVALALLCLPLCAQNNVLILVADDLGVDSVGCYAEGVIPANTPTIDKLYDLELDPFETTNLLPGPLSYEVGLRYERLSKHIEDRLAGG